MEMIKRFIIRAGRWEYLCLCLLIVVNLAIHFSIINSPKELIFDEQHYVGDARVILSEHTTSRVEHPPLGKLLVAAGIATFGDNPVGWRFFSIIFGAINILLLYLICRRLQMSRKAANIAIFLLTFENLSFVQGGVAMLDVFSLTFMMLSFWLYLRHSYPLSAVSVALATIIKLSGVLAILAILLHWLIARRNQRVYFMSSMVLAPLGFLLLMPVFEFAIYHQLVDFISSIKIMLTQSASLTFANVTHPYLLRPWTLLIFPQVMPYYYSPDYLGTISFTLWALIVPTFIYMTVRAVKKSEAGLFGVLWFAGTYLVWIPLSLITNRVSYIYYFYPMIPSICIGLGMGLSRLIDFWQMRRTGKRRWVAISGLGFFLFLHLGVFVLLSPVNPWPVKELFYGLMRS